MIVADKMEGVVAGVDFCRGAVKNVLLFVFGK